MSQYSFANLQQVCGNCELFISDICERCLPLFPKVIKDQVKNCSTVGCDGYVCESTIILNIYMHIYTFGFIEIVNNIYTFMLTGIFCLIYLSNLRASIFLSVKLWVFDLRVHTGTYTLTNQVGSKKQCYECYSFMLSCQT